MKRLFSVWIRTLYTSDINKDLTRILSGSTMPKRTKVRAAPGPVAKKVKPNPAPFSISKDFQFSPVPELMKTATVLPTPEKASTDKKEYRAIRLKNGLTVLLISDCTYPLDKLDEEEALLAAKEETSATGALDNAEEDEDEGEEEEGEEEEEEEDEEDDDEGEDDDVEAGLNNRKKTEVTGLKMSAAGLCVHMGSFSDPADIPGLAHFLEHMVFMGTEKYPDENSFDVFNRKHGGFDNASTDCETTVFYFEVPRKHFLEGLDRFAQFFIQPLMKPDSMQREREAVDSEFQMCLPSDYNRIAQIYGGIAEGHPMSKFMWGNSKSLSPEGMTDAEMSKRLHIFRDRHYSAQYMTLAVQSQHSLDTMQEWVEQIYSLVPNNGLELESFKHLDKPFLNPRYNKLFRIRPTQDIFQIDLTWSLPSTLDKYRSKPLHYLSWIIGHEGKGSLLSFLRKKVWALSLSAGCQGDGFEYNSCSSMFTISVVLTKAGFAEIENVLRAVFGYLAMLQCQGPNSRIFKEIQEIERLDYMYKEEKQPCDNVETLCENMQFFPAERFLDGDDLLFEFDPDFIKQCTDALVLESVNMFVKTCDMSESELDQVEPWFNTKYSESEIPSAWILSCKDHVYSSEFHLPEPNLFIAEDLSIRSADMEGSKYPVSLVEDKLGELFYKKDESFLQPRAYIQYLIRSHLQLQCLENSIMLDLLANCVLQLMVEDVYPADLAQLNYSLYASETGLVIKVSGLSDKLPRLMETILKHLTDMSDTIQESLFNAVLEQQRKNYYNHSIKPSKLVRDVRLIVLQDVYWSPHDKYNRVRKVTLEQLKAFSRKFLSQNFLQGLIQGNLSSSEARNIDGTVRRYLNHSPLHESASTELRCLKILEGTHFLQVEGFNKCDTNTLVTNYYQAGPGSIRDHAILEVITMLMEEPVFDTLRTQEQLGYTVFNTLRNTHGVLGFSITVNTQATKYTAEHVDERIESFLDQFVLNHLHEEKVLYAANSLAKLKVRADVTLEEEVSRNWNEIVSKEYLFNRYEKEVVSLAEIKVEDVVEYFKPLLSTSTSCRKLSVHILGYKDGVEEKEDKEEKVFNLNLLKDNKHSIKDIHEFKSKLEKHPVLYITE